MYSGKESFQKYSPHSPSILQPRQLTSSSLPASKCPPYPTYGATSVSVWKYPPSDNIPYSKYWKYLTSDSIASIANTTSATVFQAMKILPQRVATVLQALEIPPKRRCYKH